MAAKVIRTNQANVSPRRRQSRPVVIDFHSHIAVHEVLEVTFWKSEFAKSIATKSARKQKIGIPKPSLDRMSDMAIRFKEMDAMGIDIQVISPSILQQCTYWAEPTAALEMERRSNDYVAEAVSQKPDRLVGIGSVPLQDIRASVRELDRAISKLGLKGVIIGSNVNGIELGNKKLKPFWRKAEQLGAAIFIHPTGSTDPRMRAHYQLITVGQPLEEALAQGSLVYDGVMDEFPKLKVAIAHGGGYLPFYTGRHDHVQRVGHIGEGLSGSFSDYLKRFNYETVLFNPDMLSFLASKVPTKNIMMGTDYPFGERNPVEFVRSAKNISRKDQDAILGANAAKFLGIKI
ncbi:MAG: amidohydrolase family protein [Rhodospirillaceae bacterium]